jgi:hypothetical protein
MWTGHNIEAELRGQCIYLYIVGLSKLVLDISLLGFKVILLVRSKGDSTTTDTKSFIIGIGIGTS